MARGENPAVRSGNQGGGECSSALSLIFWPAFSLSFPAPRALGQPVMALDRTMAANNVNNIRFIRSLFAGTLPAIDCDTNTVRRGVIRCHGYYPAANSKFEARN